MNDRTGTPQSGDPDKSDARDELRTIGFRLREIQRLLGMRVQQENRRLEADGLEPVAETRFVEHPTGSPEASEEPRP